MKKLRNCRMNYWKSVSVAGFSIFVGMQSAAQTQLPKRIDEPRPYTKIILDTDIGDDVNDVFALGLALQSPEIEIVGVTTVWGDTALRARMVWRMLAENGRADIPVAEGIATTSRTKFSQAEWARGGLDGKS